MAARGDTEVTLWIETEGPRLAGSLALPEGADACVVFAHGSGSGRFSPRNHHVAGVLNAAGIATLLADLLDPREAVDRRLVFDIGLLARRLRACVEAVARAPGCGDLPIGLFGASTGAAAALEVAASAGSAIGAVVSRGGRPDLARDALARVVSPTLLIVGGADDVVIELNEAAFASLHCEKRLVVVPGAGHLFEEPGALDRVAAHATEWFVRWLRPPDPDSA